MISEALVCTGLQKVELLPIELPSPRAGEVLVETLYTLISPGTEARCLAGKEAFSFPFILGYSSVGRIVESGPGCTLPIGQIVFCHGTKKASLPLGWGAHCRHAVADEKRVLPLPPTVQPLEALPAKLAAISYHGAQVGRPQPHEKIAVVGLGPIGHLAALCHSLSGASVVGIDAEPWRVECLKKAGLETVVSTGSITAAVTEFFGQRADMVVDATGAAAVLPQCIDATKLLSWEWNGDPHHGARVLIQGSYEGPIAFDYREAFVRELTLLVSRNQTERDLREVMALVESRKLDLTGVISDIVPPESAPETYQRVLSREPGLLTVAFRWN